MDNFYPRCYDLGRFYNLQSSVFDTSLNRAVFFMYKPDTDTPYVFTAEGDPTEVVVFWKNRTLQNESDGGALEKQPTLTVQPGQAGQPYIAPTEGHDGYTTQQTKFSTKCVLIGS